MPKLMGNAITRLCGNINCAHAPQIIVKKARIWYNHNIICKIGVLRGESDFRAARRGSQLFDIGQKITTEKARLMNPVVLAYIGDGVHSLYEREKLAFHSDKKSGALNRLEAQKVCASSQAIAADALLPLFTADELSIYKRARNSKKGSKAKNSTAGQYVKSTGFEAVIGYLYVTGQTQRLNAVLSSADEAVAKKDADDRNKRTGEVVENKTATDKFADSIKAGKVADNLSEKNAADCVITDGEDKEVKSETY